MSTPSPIPLDDLVPVSPYAPTRAHQQHREADAAELELELRRPPGIETDHDARILDEIELSLRAMIEGNLGRDEPARLSDVSRLAAKQVAHQQQCTQPRQLNENADKEPPVEAPHRAEARHGWLPPEQLAADVATVREALRDPRRPPWLLAIPEPVGEHWPQPRKRSPANRLFLRLGLAVTGAAIVAAIAITDVPNLIMDYIRGPIKNLSTNVAAVFNEGKATPLQARMDAVQKEQDRASAPSMRYVVANVDSQARSSPVKTERAPETRRETGMTPWPSSETMKRGEPAGWQVSPTFTPVPALPSAPKAARDAAQTPRAMTGEEVAMLRKMADDYISNGDFVGARVVLERAADAGDASAAFGIASTYDPVVLARFKVRGLAPDIVKAEFWYERARALGSTEAPHRLQAMMAARGN